jgi:hypothetical protein
VVPLVTLWHPPHVSTFVCQHCGAPVRLDEPIPREATCDACGRDLRACVQCRHHDTSYNNACRETMADPVVEKDRRNFCEYFSFSREPYQPRAGSERASEARAKLSALFGGALAGTDPAAAPGETPSEAARRKLEGLFGEGKEASADREAEARHKLEGLFKKKQD